LSSARRGRGGSSYLLPCSMSRNYVSQRRLVSTRTSPKQSQHKGRVRSYCPLTYLIPSLERAYREAQTQLRTRGLLLLALYLEFERKRRQATGNILVFNTTIRSYVRQQRTHQRSGLRLVGPVRELLARCSSHSARTVHPARLPFA
jgi:hypothetical protein